MAVNLVNGWDINVRLRLVVDLDRVLISDADEVVGMAPYMGKIVIVTREGKILLVENDPEIELKIKHLAHVHLAPDWLDTKGF